MPLLELIILSSAGGLLFCWLLFYIEDKRQARFLERVRFAIDWQLERLQIVWQTSMLYVGGGALRVWLHWLFHRLLSGLMWCLQTGNEYVAYAQQRNKRVVRSVQAARSETHLAAIAAHRQATALSPKEKEALKEKSLQG